MQLIGLAAGARPVSLSLPSHLDAETGEVLKALRVQDLQENQAALYVSGDAQEVKARLIQALQLRNLST
jgi:hypothetical protein